MGDVSPSSVPAASGFLLSRSTPVSGYPIGSGAVEGACRHLVKDRLERTGMRWVREGAQAMLNLRSLWINAEWDDYQQYYVDTELDRLYPDRKSLIQHQIRTLP